MPGFLVDFEGGADAFQHGKAAGLDRNMVDNSGLFGGDMRQGEFVSKTPASVRVGVVDGNRGERQEALRAVSQQPGRSGDRA